MSIIYDALQKIQNDREDNANLKPSPKKPKSPFPKGILLGLITICIIYSIIPKSHHAEPIISTATRAPKQPPLSAHHLVLNGTFISQHNKIALINGHACNIQDKVQGMTVAAIHEHRVLLKHPSGNTIMLGMEI